MELIKRKINLESMKNRFCDVDTEWGGFPNDIVIEGGLLELADTLPLYKGNILRYRTMLDRYSWLSQYIKASKIYSLCRRNSKRVWVEMKGNPLDYNGCSELPEILSGLSIGDTYHVNYAFPEYESIFKTNRLAKKFLELVENKVSGTSQPFFTISISLNSDIEDMGIYTTSVDFWISKKKYHIGDKVFINTGDEDDGVWEMIRGTEGYDKIEITGEYANLLLSGETFGKEVITSEEEIDFSSCQILSGGTSYFIYPYTRSKEFTFEENWKHIIDGTSVSSVMYEIKSQIQRLKRPRSLAVDINGRTYPFVLIDDVPELPFVVNTPLHIRMADDKVFCDMVKSIETGETESGETIINFEYTIGEEIELTPSGYTTVSEGIRYYETYPYAFKEEYIDFGEGENYYEYVDIDFTETIAIGRYMGENTAGVTANIYKDDMLMGVLDINENIDVEIERGIAAAFERHNVLGEINTFEDMLKYKNDFFGLKN